MKGKVTHPVKVLMRPILPLLESRMEEMLMLAYDEGYKNGKASWKIPISDIQKKQFLEDKKNREDIEPVDDGSGFESTVSDCW